MKRILLFILILFVSLVLLGAWEARGVEGGPIRSDCHYRGYTKIAYGRAVTNCGDTIAIAEYSELNRKH